ncbi:hypothetical protein YTPLAS18_30560 [Nitrospira sp.]|nr:hypothetical protein YTPLAS18_30560 [Nitrospira sp.]
MIRRRPSRLLAFTLATVLAGPTAYGFYRWEEGNFHEVSPQQVYRSRQLSGSEFMEAERRYGIKSVLNLRGPNHGSQWYQDEVEVAHRLGLRLYDYPITASRELTAEQIGQLVTILRESPKPILIHCKSGADRTSLVSALYLVALDRSSVEVASQQLSFYYGHLPAFLGTETSAMDRTFWRLIATRQGPWGLPLDRVSRAER